MLYKNPNRSALPKTDLNIAVFIYSKFYGNLMPRDYEITAAFKDAIKLDAKSRRIVTTNYFRLALEKWRSSTTAIRWWVSCSPPG